VGTGFAPNVSATTSQADLDALDVQKPNQKTSKDSTNPQQIQRRFNESTAFAVLWAAIMILQVAENASATVVSQTPSLQIKASSAKMAKNSTPT